MCHIFFLYNLENTSIQYDYNIQELLYVNYNRDLDKTDIHELRTEHNIHTLKHNENFVLLLKKVNPKKYNLWLIRRLLKVRYPSTLLKRLKKERGDWDEKTGELGGRDIPSLHLGLRGCWFLGLHLGNNCESFQFIESFCRSDEFYSGL